MTIKIIRKIENMFKTDKRPSGYPTFLVECSGCKKQYPMIKYDLGKGEYCCSCANKIKAGLDLSFYKRASARLQQRHGMKGTHFYKKWQGLNIRCRYPNGHGFKNYGGRGIVCEWNCFEDFKKDMYDSYLEHVKIYGEKDTTIDRINNNGNYCKDNCRRATMKEQQLSKRTNIKLEYKGKIYPTLQSLCEEKGLPYGTIHMRLKKYKMSIEDAIDRPIYYRLRKQT